MKNLKDQVKQILIDDEKSRNSDIRLTQMMWYRFHNSKVVELPDKTLAVIIKDLFELPREDHLSRIRRKIQEEAFEKVEKGYRDYIKYLPTSLEVIKQRKMNEEKWRSFLGYNPEMITV